MGASRPVSVFLLLCFCYLCTCSVQSRRIVKHLPGYNGPLPFTLETGYVMVDEVNGGELFYYFIESEGNPSKDPLLLWLTGGNRCSALSGLIFEIGPLKIVKSPFNGSIPELEYHPYAWTQNASIIFLDSPLGAGFSYSSNSKGYEVGDTVASSQIHKFLMEWVVDHPQYLAHPFYVAGDSYAGKIVPFVAQLISEGIEAGQQQLLNLKHGPFCTLQSTVASLQKRKHCQSLVLIDKYFADYEMMPTSFQNLLQGYMVGNPSTGEKNDFYSRVSYAHGHGIISDQLFELTQQRCVTEDHTNPSTALCAEVLDVVEDLTHKVGRAHILEPHCILVSPATKDIVQNRRFLKDDYSIQLSKPEEPPFYCRSYSYYLSYFWANDSATREALGIKKKTKKEWQRCTDLPYEKDINSSIKYHHNLTSRGYRALVYSGDHDLLVPFLGTQAWVRSLNFPVMDAWRAWHVDGQTAGFTETYSNNLTFATIVNGGHTAPEYRPVECLAMFARWISYQPL